MVYDPRIDDRRLTFGVTGALYNSAAVLYDHQTESLWAQPLRKSIAGALTGAELAVLPSRRTTWSQWLREHPQTLVLSADTGYRRDYQSNPYAPYQEDDQVLFPVQRKKSDCKLPPKARVLGLEVDGKRRAYPLGKLKKLGRARDELGNALIDLVYDRESKTASAYFADGRPANSVIMYWFAWQSFHPETDCREAWPSSR